MPELIRLIALSKSYRQGDQLRHVLRGAEAHFEAGETVAIRGRSGSGKTTLLNLVAGLDTPDSGSILYQGQDLTRLSSRDRTLFRRRHIGIVFQFFNLIPTLSVIENVLLPADLSGSARDSAESRAYDLIGRVGLSDRTGEFPDRLSGGEQQRVAIARALIMDPEVVLADEPTGNLDHDTGEQVMDLLQNITKAYERTLILVTHSHRLAERADRTLTIEAGQLVPETDLTSPVVT